MYTYVADNPLGYIDPSGMTRFPACGVLVHLGQWTLPIASSVR